MKITANIAISDLTQYCSLKPNLEKFALVTKTGV